MNNNQLAEAAKIRGDSDIKKILIFTKRDIYAIIELPQR